MCSKKRLLKSDRIRLFKIGPNIRCPDANWDNPLCQNFEGNTVAKESTNFSTIYQRPLSWVIESGVRRRTRSRTKDWRTRGIYYQQQLRPELAQEDCWQHEKNQSGSPSLVKRSKFSSTNSGNRPARGIYKEQTENEEEGVAVRYRLILLN